MKIDSKRRWKARILEKRDIPGYVTTYYPDLLFWLLENGYRKQVHHYVCSERLGGTRVVNNQEGVRTVEDLTVHTDSSEPQDERTANVHSESTTI